MLIICRIIIMELARIADHLICNSIMGNDAGNHRFLYVMQFREDIYEIWEEVQGFTPHHQYWADWRFERDFNDIAFVNWTSFLIEYPKCLCRI